MRASSPEEASRRPRSDPAEDSSRFAPPPRKPKQPGCPSRRKDLSGFCRAVGVKRSNLALRPFFQALTESQLPMPASGSLGGNPERYWQQQQQQHQSEKQQPPTGAGLRRHAPRAAAAKLLLLLPSFALTSATRPTFLLRPQGGSLSLSPTHGRRAGLPWSMMGRHSGRHLVPLGKGRSGKKKVAVFWFRSCLLSSPRINAFFKKKNLSAGAPVLLTLRLAGGGFLDVC